MFYGSCVDTLDSDSGTSAGGSAAVLTFQILEGSCRLDASSKHLVFVVVRLMIREVDPVLVEKSHFSWSSIFL